MLNFTLAKRCVIDISAILAVLLNEPEKADTIQKTQACQLSAPHSLPHEIGNALVSGLRRRRLTLAQALTAVATFEAVPIQLVAVDLAESVRLADRLGIYAYDAYVVACALQEQLPLVTLDARLATVAAQSGIVLL